MTDEHHAPVGAVVWLMIGFVIGGLMLTDRKVPGDWRLWLSPGHGHMLFVGWFLQFAMGLSYWLLPRKRTPISPSDMRSARLTWR